MTANVNKKVKISGENDIKNEEELKPMSFYIDDRLELVKQIFSTLKPKTIKSLAPEFLKESTIEEIEELCLNELLGISSKRLKSIIYEIPCPSDTESSDSNADENISLEEISSDSDDADQVKRKKANKFEKGKKNKLENDEKEHGKEISVLELLELQARARAIRSQLALEPIAKVELDDSEDSGKFEDINKLTEKKLISQKHSKVQSSTLKSTSSLNSKPVSNGNPKCSKIISITSSGSNSTTSKPIKLKRNFIKVSSENNTSSILKSNFIENTTGQMHSSSEKTRDVLEKNKKEIKDMKTYRSRNLDRPVKKTLESIDTKRTIDIKSERSSSPDVLTILPSPEVLSVCDSSDEEKRGRINITKDEKFDSESESSSTQSSNTSLSSEESDSESLDEKTNPEQMEDLRNLIQRKKIKEKENEKIPPIMNEKNSKENNNIKDSSDHIISHKPKDDENIEKSDKLNDVIKEITPKSSLSKETENSFTETSKTDVSDNNCETNLKSSLNEITSSKKQLVDCVICKVESDNTLENSNNNIKQDDDNHNDDVISLGDAELDYGINDHIGERANPKVNIPDTPLSPEVNQSEPEEAENDDDNEENDNENNHDKNDFIDLHDSSVEEVANEESNSWNDRWLKSSKVSKILAASKLGNKVRDKVKKSKKAEREKEQQQHRLQQQQEISEKRDKNSVSKNKVLSNLEEGSVKQYEKIKEISKSPKK